MADFKHCDCFLLRYVPDVVKQEFVNVGVVMLEEGDGGFTDVRFTRDWRRVRCLDPEVDIDLLQSYEDELRRVLQSRAAEVINYKLPMSRREWLLDLMQQSFSGALQLAPMQAVLTESPEAELGILARAYLESERRPSQREAAGRRAIYNVMRGAFEQAGVWQFMRKDIAVATYAGNGDPLKIDCAYRPENVVQMFHAVSLATDVNAAKVLAFSYQNFRDQMALAENADPNLHAVIEDGLDWKDPAVAFALEALDRYGIDVATAAQMPAIAERARVELKL
ncbi:MAG: DUF3037 domain-containing protein [Candidatus Korobacteraceae bacterium]